MKTYEMILDKAKQVGWQHEYIDVTMFVKCF